MPAPTRTRITVTLAGATLQGWLNDSPAARDFASLLPLSVSLSDFHGRERIADLPRRLDTSGAPDSATGHSGDITYYAPWGNLALFYRTSAPAPGLVKLGELSPDATEILAELDDNSEATIARPE
jgi:hypothetical protein